MLVQLITALLIPFVFSYDGKFTKNNLTADTIWLS